MLTLRRALAVSIATFFALTWSNSLYSQNSANGTIDCIFSTNWGSNGYPPQTVIWTENESGEYVGTVSITDGIGRDGFGNRDGNPDISTSNNRYDALPTWAYRRNVLDYTYGIPNYYPPDQYQSSYPDDIDAVSSATPHMNVEQTKSWQLSAQPSGEYNCWIEVNQAFDKNEYHNYPEYWRGQPAVFWNVRITVDSLPDTNTVLDYTGYSSPDYPNGSINPPDSTITTACNLLNNLGNYRFKVIYTPASGVEEKSLTLNDHSTIFLVQNYPNPFSQFTVIKYQLSHDLKPCLKSNECELKIYDLKGGLVRTLVDEPQEPGMYVIEWSSKDNQGKRVTGGIYFCRLSYGNSLAITKILLFK